MRRVLVLSYLGLTTYILLPAAPPWFAAEVGAIDDPVGRVAGFGFGIVPLDVSTRWLEAQGNPVAAMPSLHAGFAFLVVALLALRALRHASARRNLIEVRYGNGQVVRVAKGSSVLEASRIGGIPHYSVCGGKGRCSTCRIRVTAGVADLPPAGALERVTLSRIHAGPDVRLACQLRPTHDLAVLPLLAADRERTLPSGAGHPCLPSRR